MQFTLCPVADSDENFLYHLYDATHGQQFALLPVGQAQREALVRMQFTAQRIGYRQQYPASEDFVILKEGQPAGRAWLDRSGVDVRLIDIAILPQFQSGGLGSAVLRQILDDARSAGKSVRLSVGRMNVRACEFYRGLGFDAIGGDEVYLEMIARCEPPAR